MSLGYAFRWMQLGSPSFRNVVITRTCGARPCDISEIDCVTYQNKLLHIKVYKCTTTYVCVGISVAYLHNFDKKVETWDGNIPRVNSP